MSLHSEIRNLIHMHQEGPYWDFKKEWYGKEKDADQLLDIICMANNLTNRDAYIIIGIDEENNYAVCTVEQDTNRRNTQMITDFLRGKKFAGEFRPTVTVESLCFGKGVIDVMVIHNSVNTPFFLKESYKKVVANNIYIRLQDSNTPSNQSADFHHIEYLWKKRFGMLMTPTEKMMMYLKHPEDWAYSPSQEDKRYYKFAPEFTIEYTDERDHYQNSYEYYLFAQTNSKPYWCDIRINYHQTVLAEMGGVILDGGRYFTATPRTDGVALKGSYHWDVSYKYMIKGTLNYLVHCFYYKDDGGEARHAHNEFENSILIFESEQEHEDFNAYIFQNWYRKEEFSDNIRLPYFEPIEGYDMDACKEIYRNVQVLRKMLDEFRIIYKNDYYNMEYSQSIRHI